MKDIQLNNDVNCLDRIQWQVYIRYNININSTFFKD